MPQQLGPAYGGGSGGGAYEIALKPNGKPAVFTTVTAMNTFYNTNPKPGSGKATAIGTVDASGQPLTLTAAFTWKSNKWVPIATNFMGAKGTPGKDAMQQDLTGFKPNEIPIVDPTTGLLKESGVFAGDGDVTMEPDSATIGSHRLSSSAENLTVTNLATTSIYSPLWQEIAPNVKHAYIREHGAMEQKIRYKGSTRSIINPEFDLLMDEDSTVFSIETYLANPTTNLVLEVYLGTKKLYRASWPTLPQGAVTLDLKTPADFKKGVTYKVKLFSRDGNVTFRGGSVGVAYNFPKWIVNRVLWKDVELATKDWVKDNANLEVVLWASGRSAPFDSNDVYLDTLTRDEYVGKAITAVGSVNVQTIQLPDLTKGVIKPGDKIAISNQSETPGGWVSVVSYGSQAMGGLANMYLPTGSNLIIEAPARGNSWVTVTNPVGLNAGVQSGAPTPGSYGPAHTMKPITQIMADPGAGEIVDTTTGGSALLIKNNAVKSLVFDSTHNVLTITDESGNVSTVTIPTGSGGGAAGTTGGNAITHIHFNPDGTFTTILGNGASNTDTVPINPQISGDINNAKAMGLSNASKINSLQMLVNTISQGAKDGGVYVYKGKVPVTPNEAKSVYFITVEGSSSPIIEANMPDPSIGSLPDGAIYFIVNQDVNSRVKLNAVSGQTIDYATSINIPPNNQVSLMVFDKAKSVWKIVFSGYIPFALFNLLSSVRKDLAPQLHTDDEIKALAKGVVLDPNTMNLIALALERMGFAKKGQVKPDHPKPASTASAYAIFSPDAIAPTTLDPGLPVFRNGAVNVHKNTVDGQYVYIFIPPGEEKDANRIGEKGGIPSIWARETKVYNTRTYTVFRSPYKFHEKDATFIIYP